MWLFAVDRWSYPSDTCAARSMRPDTDMPPNWRERMRPLPLSPRFIALAVVVAAGVVTVVALGYLAFLLALRPPPVCDVPIAPDVLDGHLPIRGRTADDAVRNAQRLGFAVRVGEPVCPWPCPSVPPTRPPASATNITIIPRAGVIEHREGVPHAAVP